MDQSEHRTRWPQGQRVANGGSVGNSLALGPTAPTPNRTQVYSRFNTLDLRWQRRVHVRHCYLPRELANGEFATRFCNVCPIWRWPDIGGNALTHVAVCGEVHHGIGIIGFRTCCWICAQRYARACPARSWGDDVGESLVFLSRRTPLSVVIDAPL